MSAADGLSLANEFRVTFKREGTGWICEPFDAAHDAWSKAVTTRDAANGTYRPFEVYAELVEADGFDFETYNPDGNTDPEWTMIHFEGRGESITEAFCDLVSKVEQFGRRCDRRVPDVLLHYFGNTEYRAALGKWRASDGWGSTPPPRPNGAP